MNQAHTDHLNLVLKHLYINPLEKCNLRCAICYTRKTDPILSQERIETFIQRYKEKQEIETVTFCGGEVFTLPYFTALVNNLTDQGIFVQMITNGTIDRLNEFTNPNFVNLIVSLDGLEEYHDKNRGKGNFQKSIKFLQKGILMGFHTEIFSIVTRQNNQTIDEFETYLSKTLGKNVQITYHPRKPPTYLLHHPISNIIGKTEEFDFLTHEEMISLMKTRRTFPPKDLGCYQIALTSTGKIYGCCEGITPIGAIDDDIQMLFGKMKERLTVWEEQNPLSKCLGCTSPDFVCGIKSYLHTL